MCRITYKDHGEEVGDYCSDYDDSVVSHRKIGKLADDNVTIEDDHWFLYNDQDTTELNVKQRANENYKCQVVLLLC